MKVLAFAATGSSKSINNARTIDYWHTTSPLSSSSLTKETRSSSATSLIMSVFTKVGPTPFTVIANHFMRQIWLGFAGRSTSPCGARFTCCAPPQDK